MNFILKLEERRKKVNNCLCIGLDPEEIDIKNFMNNEKENEYENIKNNLTNEAIKVIEKRRDILFESIETIKSETENELFYFLNHFCLYIINVTNKYALAYKINFAFYVVYGSIGIDVLKNIFDYLNYLNIPTILDMKINDIGNTIKNYRKFVFEYLKSDSVTVNIYMGTDILKDICYDEIKERHYSVFVLIKTTNPDSYIYQNQLSLDNEEAYLVMASEANKMSEELKMKENNEFIGYVIGSNSLKELDIIRKKYPDCYILCPGIGAQKGNLEKTLLNGFSKNFEKIIINVGRDITKNQDPEKAALHYHQQINHILLSI